MRSRCAAGECDREGRVGHVSGQVSCSNTRLPGAQMFLSLLVSPTDSTVNRSEGDHCMFRSVSSPLEALFRGKWP